jgi:hypothetical protein
MIVCRKATDRTESQQEFQEPSLGIVSVFAGYRVRIHRCSCSTAAIMASALYETRVLRERLVCLTAVVLPVTPYGNATAVVETQ